MTPIILLCGAKGSGKDTAGAVLKDLGATVIAFADPMKQFVLGAFGGTFTREVLWGPSELRSMVWSSPGVSWYELSEDISRTARHYARVWDLQDTFVRAVSTWAAAFIRPHCSVENHANLTARWVLQTFGTEMGRAFDKNLWAHLGLEKAFKALESGAPAVVITDGRFRNEILAVAKVGGVPVKIQRPIVASMDPHPSEVELQGIPSQWFDHIVKNDSTLEVFKKEIEILAEFYLDVPKKPLTEQLEDAMRTPYGVPVLCAKCSKNALVNREGWCIECFAAASEARP
jgi:hypothetical protein